MNTDEQSKRQNDTKHEKYSQSPIAGMQVDSKHQRDQICIDSDVESRHKRDGSKLIPSSAQSFTQKNGHSIYKTRRRPLHRSTAQKSKLITNSQLRSIFCGRFPDRNHHTRPWRSTSLGRWTVTTEWILQSRQSTSSLVEPQSSP